ncbi:MAG: iron ABC transporter permease [Gammaproteobacteria bacterium]|jgi:iron complex transport system permease protein|nr:iron ABC transporter permease [Gammaproteobacteria bacterium]
MIRNPQRSTPGRLLTLLVISAVIALAAAIGVGSGQAGPLDVIDALLGQADPGTRDILLRLRLPRALAAFGTGASLALAGVLMQVLLRNPLADPYILGTSGGAAVAALTAMLAGAASLTVDIAAFGGALGSTLLVFIVARYHGNWSPGRLLLTGVVIAAGWSAVISLILALAPETNLRGILFWLMGDFAFAGNPWPTLLVAMLATAAGLALARSLNVLSVGDAQAALLGLRVRPVRTIVYLLSALLTAIAVTTAGTVGFIGLVVPHLVRLISGSDHRTLIPGAALAGGILLVIADLVARSIIAPRQLPVGAITAVIGVPLFLFLLGRTVTSED